MDTKILDRFKNQAIAAHNWTSFSPEKRGESMVNEFSAELSGDIAELEAAGISAESIIDYQARYERYFSSYLGAKGRCMSSMITGPSNFPVRRAEKANRSEQNHYNIFREWRIKAKKAIVRKAQPAKTFSSELERYKTELAKLQAYHATMKACNAIIKKAKGGDCREDLIKAGVSSQTAAKIVLPDFANRIGFASFHLTNNNANMKRIEGKIREFEVKEVNSLVLGATNHIFEGGKVIMDYSEDRIKIMHDSKPTRDQLTALKAKGLNTFNWSPSNGAWQRKITPAAIWALEQITGVKI